MFPLNFRPQTWVLDYLYQRQLEMGSIKFVTPSDSIGSGANYNQGLVMPFVAGLAALGIEAKPVGTQVDATGNLRVLRNSYGGNSDNNSFGGKTTADLVTGSNSVTQILADCLKTYNPDIILGAFGTNDPPSGGYPEAFRDFWEVVDTYAKTAPNPYLPTIYVSPFNSNDTTANLFSNSAGLDTGRLVTKEAYRDLVRKRNRAQRVLFVDGMKAMGMFARYQNSDPTANVGNANMIFYDGTHPSKTGNALLVASALAQMAGCSPAYILELMAGLEPYSPIDLSDAADITAGNSASWGTAEDLKHVLMSLTVTNIGAVTATATVYRSRYKNDLSGSTDTAALATLKIPAGATRGWTFPCPGNVSKYATGPVAWYNERWKVAIAGADCNVALTAKRMLV